MPQHDPGQITSGEELLRILDGQITSGAELLALVGEPAEATIDLGQGPPPLLEPTPADVTAVAAPAIPPEHIRSLVEGGREFNRELGLLETPVPALPEPTNELAELAAAARQPLAADVLAVPLGSRRPDPPPTIRAATAPEEMETAIVRAREADARALQERFEKIPLPVRVAGSGLRAFADATTVGHIDELVNKANQVVAATLGVDAPKLSTDEVLDMVERTGIEKFAGGLGFIGGAGAVILTGNQLLSSLSPLARQGSRARALLQAFDPSKPVSVGTRALQGAVEGLPFDLAFDADSPQERARNVALGLVLGGLLGPLVGGKVKRGGVDDGVRPGAIADPGDVTGTIPGFRPEGEAPVAVSRKAVARRRVAQEAPDVVEPVVTTPPAVPPPAPIIEGVPTPPPRITSLKKAEGAAIRERLGLDALDPPQRESFADAWDTASEQGLSENAVETAEAAVAARRPLRPEEHAAALQRQLILEDQLADSRSVLESAARAGNDEVVQREMLRTDGILEQINSLTRSLDSSGTEASRALGARRMQANADTHSLASNLQQARSVKGSQLTPGEIGTIEVPVARAKKIDAEVGVELRKVREADTVRKRALADVVVAAESRRAVRAGGASAERLVVERTELLEQLADIGQRLNDVGGVSGEGLYLIGRLAVNTIRTTVLQTGERVALSRIVDSVLADLNNPSITVRDIHEALNARSPKAVTRARTEVQRQVSELRSQARILTKIDDAEQGIFAPARPRPPRSSEIRALQRQLTALRQTAYQTGQDSRGIERAVKRINDLQDQLTNAFRTVRRARAEPSSELAGLQEKIRALRQEMGVEDRLLILQDQLRTGEFVIPEPRRAPPSSPSLEAKQIALKRARQQVRAAIQAMQPRTVRGAIRAGTELTRTIKATADFSATMRQGFLLSTRRPLVAARTFDKSVRAFFSRYTADQIDNAIRQHPNQMIRERAGLELADIGSGVTGEREEFFASSLASKIPAFGAVVRASERSMTTTLNLLRTSAFDGFLDANPNATIEELTAWASTVNILSGRGDLGRLGAVGTELSTLVFAPRFAISRIQAPLQLFKYWHLPRVRKAIAKEYAATAAVGLTALTLADLAGLEVGIDPRGSDWGKIRFGDTRIDIWGGVQQPMRVVARIVLGGTDKAGLTGRALTDQEKEVDPFELLGRFAGYKASPFLSIPRELYRGKTAVGEPRTPSQTAVRSMLPLVFEDILEAHRASGPGTAAITGALAVVGVGVSTFQDSEGRVRRDVRELLEEGQDEEATQRVLRWNELNPDNQIRSVRPRRPTSGSSADFIVQGLLPPPGSR